tara:strand:- start:11 stop:196 length:186 start_codon:yes stop_codon:yes gene_type:complete
MDFSEENLSLKNSQDDKQVIRPIKKLKILSGRSKKQRITVPTMNTPVIILVQFIYLDFLKI